jgi:hypothetical protein
MKVVVREGEPVTLRRTRGPKTVIWSIRFDGPTISRTWGQENGKMQNGTDVEDPVNVGKKNERSGTSQAKLRVEREIRKKMEDGFQLASAEHEEGEIDPYAGPPSTFRGPKPKNAAPKSLMAHWSSERLRIMRKHNGMCFPVFINIEGTPVIYVRRFLPTSQVDGKVWNERFPKITQLFQDRASPIKSYKQGELRFLPPVVPPMSMFMCEIVAPWWDKEEKCLIDDFEYVGSITKSSTEEALVKQEDATAEGQSGYLVAVVLDLWMWDGVDVLETMTWGERREILERVIPDMDSDAPVLLVADEKSDPSSKSMSPQEFLDYAEDVGWEGYVLVNGEVKFPKGMLNFTGDTKRPSSYAKMKPIREDDFVAFWEPEKKIGSYGKGKHRGQIGAIALYQIDKAGNFVFVSNVASGMTDKQKKEWADPKEWPKVVRITYDHRTVKGSLHIPRFDCVRDDKELDECILPE